MQLLAKKYGIEEDTLLNHLAKNRWAAEVLVNHPKVRSKVEKIGSGILDAVLLASVFHDLGKANKSFQDKLIDNKIKSELLTHDAISFMFLFELYQKRKKQGDINCESILFAAYAALKHHNRSLFIEKLPESSSGLKNIIQKAFAGIKDYTDVRKTNVEIDDSQWIRRSGPDGEVVKLNIYPEVISVYSNPELAVNGYIQDVEEFILKINNLPNSSSSVNIFVQQLGKMMRIGDEASMTPDADLYYCKLLLTKNLFKICDEFASRTDVSNDKIEYKKEFENFVENFLFFDQKALTELATKLVKGDQGISPNIVQKEILESDDLADCILLSSNTGGGKTVSAELIQYKKRLNFISYHTPTRFLALEQASRVFDSLKDLLVAKQIRYIPQMSMYHHTIDQVYLSLVGFKREYLFLKLFFGGIVVFDEIDIFQDRNHFFNIAFMLKILSKLKIPVVITTATATNTLVEIIKKNYNGTYEEFPKKQLENTAIRATCSVFKNTSGDNYLSQITNKLKEHYNEGRKTGIFFNSVSSCVLLALNLKKNGIPYVLYHSRLSKDVKEHNKENLINSFNKSSKTLDKYPIAIMSPLAEVGVDISFEVMFTDAAPVRNIEQRMGRLNRWRNFENCILYILDDYICGFGSKKEPHLPKIYNGKSICSYDPYFAVEKVSFIQHNHEYRLLDSVQLGYEKNFLQEDVLDKMNKYKDLWFHGILFGVKRYILNPESQKVKYNEATADKDYVYSLSILPFIFIKSANENFINQCFREVNAVEYVGEDEAGRLYTSIPNYYVSNNRLKNDYQENEEFGITKKWIFDL